MTKALARPSYDQVLGYYLRDDVSDFFWRLCQRRRLKFFHHCDTDPRAATRARPRAISLHCLASVEELCSRITAAARPIPEYPYPFFPFWGMQSNQVNAPGELDRIIGWDMRFEFDYGLRDSFAVLLPVVAVLKHFGVPTLLKYSGHRSLHLAIPAEAFPLPMKRQADLKRWMAAMELLGDLFCRIAPYLIPTNVGLSKDLTLTAPYSFHRYHGLISLPLSLEQALAFDPQQATLEEFHGPLWTFPDPGYEGAEMEALLNQAQRVQEDPSLVVDLAQNVFRGRQWAGFIQENVPSDIPADSALAVLMAGSVGVNQAHAFRDWPPHMGRRLRQALVANDDPVNKTIKFGGLVGATDYHHSLEHAVWHRRIRAEVLSAWTMEGLDAAFERIVAIASDDRYASPVLLAVRLYSFLPETDERLAAKLVQAWKARDLYGQAARLFTALALGERCAGQPQVLATLCEQGETPAIRRFQDMLCQADAWRGEARPDLVWAALVLGFGEDMVRSWIIDPATEAERRIVEGIFGGKVRKLQHSALRVGLLSDAELRELQRGRREAE